MTDFADDVPTEADLDECYGSKFLSGTELGDRRIRTKIARVRKQALPQQGGGTKTKFILSFTTMDKELVLNVTNKDVLVEALGRNPANWIGADLGLFTEATNMGRGVRLRVLNKAIKAAPVSKPAPKPDTPAWPEQADDPGADFLDAAE